MAQTDSVTSIRTESVGHCMHKPKPQFDACFSEFRDSAVGVLMYQITTSLDKVINISLGKANSSESQVFRIALVKGVPPVGA
ncbi:DNA polymerase zeta catalytic subunit-like [Toxorhynchites rutilus septentrionalis]|uniref:DNA polymerase zeta catalytic subunit-like n=1 Tax=Toxorhynchites rutilus septentrionalis TaxID=329112 RepID=UPI002479C941|nr:DNA polymerase zeta catalytic subunit-like [Toxorhynchites rutilus septentrionalis]